MPKERKRLLTTCCACVVLASTASRSDAQILFGADPTTPAASAPAFQPPSTASSFRRTLRQVDALIADRAWDEAIDAIEFLQARQGDEVVDATKPEASADAFPRWVTVAEVCQAKLAALPTEGLVVYRDRVDATARRWLREGRKRADAELLRRVADEFRASSYGADAMLTLADLALQRGETAEARRRLRRISPLLWGPLGDPLHVALAGVRSDVEAADLAEAWRSTPRPDTLGLCVEAGAPLADPLARLIVASLRDGDPIRAASELALLEALAPDAEGRLAGRVQPLAPTLREMIESAAATPTASLDSLHAWRWPSSVEVTKPPVDRRQQLARQQAMQRFLLQQQRAPAARQALLNQLRRTGLASTPLAEPPRVVTSDRRVLFVDASGLRQVDVDTGETRAVRLSDDPAAATPQPLARQQRLGGVRVAVGGVQIQNGQVRWFTNGVANTQAARVLPNTLALHGDVAYAVTTQMVMRRSRQGRTTRGMLDTLVGVDLASEDKPILEIAGDKIEADGRYRFTGPPTPHGDGLYAVLAAEGVGATLSLARFDRVSGRLDWRVDLGSGQPLGGYNARSTQVAVAPPVVRGGTAYVATDLGAIAAVDVRRGVLRWIRGYERLPAVGAGQATPPSPCVVRGDRLFAAPGDSPYLLALDATDGRVLWLGGAPDAGAAIAGVVGDTLVVAGGRVALYDAATGRRRSVWPESDRAGVRGIGRGVLVGSEFFWPTRDQIFCFVPTMGGFGRPPIPLDRVSRAGANLAVAGETLVVAGPERINALGDRPAAPAELPAGLTRFLKAAADDGALARAD